MTENETIKGVQVFIIKDKRVLVGFHKKKNFFGVPGGHIEQGETPEQAAYRESLEECGVECSNLSLLDTSEFYNPQKEKTYLNYTFIADYLQGVPRDDSAEDIVNWVWMTPEEAISENLYPTAKTLLLKLIKNNQI